jgi:hypothetical protein
MINCQVCGTEFDDHFELEKHFDSAHDVIKPSSHFEHENEDGANFQPLSSSKFHNIDIIEEINDTLKGSDDSNAQTNEIKVKSANVKSPGIDTLKGSDDSNDQSNEIKVESVRNIIVDINHADSLDIHEFDFAKAEFVFDFESNEINLEENFKNQSAHEKKKPYAFEPVPGIDTLKGSDDSNDQTNEINVESVHSFIVDIVKEICDQIAINDDQLSFEAIEKSVHDGKKPVPAPRRDLKSSLSSTKEKKKVFGQSEFRSYATKAYEKD